MLYNNAAGIGTDNSDATAPFDYPPRPNPRSRGAA